MRALERYCFTPVHTLNCREALGKRGGGVWRCRWHAPSQRDGQRSGREGRWREIGEEEVGGGGWREEIGDTGEERGTGETGSDAHRETVRRRAFTADH